MNAMERLTEAMLRKNSRIVAGLDPKWENIPTSITSQFKERDDPLGILAYCEEYIKAISPYAAAIKINSGYFEAIQAEDTYRNVAYIAKMHGLFVIGDVKRGDIGASSEVYAKAFLGEGSSFDAITINPYFGTDSVEPFIKMAVENKKGLFVLVKTSNKSSCELQDLMIADGQLFYEKVAELVKKWGAMTPQDQYGYNCVGAVVGATHPEQAARLRQLMPNTFFLVPGYGAQGATAKDVVVNFDEKGLGAIVNSSRGIMCAYQKEKFIKAGVTWQQATESALVEAVEEINSVL